MLCSGLLPHWLSSSIDGLARKTIKVMDTMTDIKMANGVEEISAKLNPINRLKIEYGIN